MKVFIQKFIKAESDIPRPKFGTISNEMFIEDIKGNGYYANYYFMQKAWIDYNSKEPINYPINWYLEEREMPDDAIQLLRNIKHWINNEDYVKAGLLINANIDEYINKLK